MASAPTQCSTFAPQPHVAVVLRSMILPCPAVLLLLIACYLNLLLRGKPFGGSRPASARLPRQSASSFSVSEKVRPDASLHVRPSLAGKVFTSDSPPSLKR